MAVGAPFNTQRVSGELEMGKLVKIGPHCGEACLKQCMSNGNGFTAERASEEGGVIVRAITKDPELLMVPAMIDPSRKFIRMENVFGRAF